MRVKMIATSAGPDGVRQSGRVFEVSAKEGKELCKGGFAEPVAEKPEDRAEKREEGEQAEGGEE